MGSGRVTPEGEDNEQRWIVRGAPGPLRDVLTGYVKRGRVPGVVAPVSRRGRVHAGALGPKDVSSRAPMRPIPLRDLLALRLGIGAKMDFQSTHPPIQKAAYSYPREDPVALLMTKRRMDSPDPARRPSGSLDLDLPGDQ